MLLHLGQAPVLVISSAEMAREIMKNQDTVFTNRPALTAVWIVLYQCQDVGFAPYGEYWRQMRKICVSDLLGVKRVQSFKFVREVEIDCLIKKISQSCSKGSPVNLSDMLLTLSYNILSMCSFGRKSEKVDNIHMFGKLSREVLQLLGAFSIGDFFPCLRWMDVLTGLIGRLKRRTQQLDVLFDGIIDDHLKKGEIQNSLDNKQDFVDLLLHVQREKKLSIGISKDSIKAIMMTREWIYYPPKTRVYINAWAIQRDPMTWDKAEEFIPERFSESTVDFKGQDFELVPFGSGRRSCPGMSFGIAVVELALANLLYWFDWELPNGELKEMLDMSESFGLTVNKKIPLLLLPSHYVA
ncbi:hypothetical protein Syun_030408 [Stephania yunnanensis]|uniref:Cytochrome P450 n=1 Tax=Stephania yunnanensis TaxID=152371 RepID=A0AAP0EFR2_9MAGN